VTFSGALTVKDGPLGREYQLFGYPAPLSLVNDFVGLTMALWLCISTGFWSGFFTAQSNPECNNSSQSYMYTSEVICRDEWQVAFFPFSFSFLQGISVAGGILAMATMVVKSKIKFLMWLVIKKNTCRSPLNRHVWKFSIVVTEITAGVLVSAVAVCSLFEFIPNFADITQLLIDTCKFYGFNLALIFSSFFSLCLLIVNWRVGEEPQGHDIEAGVVVADTSDGRDEEANETTSILIASTRYN